MLNFLYFLINFLGAVLIFSIQPMVAKAALPILGGVPFVWAGCMVFFQAMLLCAYIYAHVLNNYASRKLNVIFHLGLFLTAWVAVLPLDIKAVFAEEPDDILPQLWLIKALIICVALPFFVVAATSPLSQSWYAKSGGQKKPYVLYAASNAGSFVGLFSYPLVIESNITLAQQGSLFSFSFYALFILFVIAGFYLLKAKGNVLQVGNVHKSTIPASYKLLWVALAFIPSSLLYGVTNYITLDIASFPLLWIIPLGIYIFSFVLVFGEKGREIGSSKISHFALATAMIIYIKDAIADSSITITVIIAVHLVTLFIICMTVHQKLYDTRPQDSRNMTSFYIYMSLGGVLGGIFNTFIAPEIFNSIAEYAIILFLSLFIWLEFRERDIRADLKFLLNSLIYISIAVVLVFVLLEVLSERKEWVQYVAKSVNMVMLVTGMLVILRYIGRPTIAIISLSMIIFLSYLILKDSDSRNIIYEARSIFGISKVAHDNNTGERIFIHGTTIHGTQRFDGIGMTGVNTYYYPLLDIFSVVNSNEKTKNKPVAVVGLGVGILNCYGKKNQQFDLYEIDPTVQKIAEEYFTYMRDCLPEKEVHIGDGRVNISKQADGKYGVIILDAFSSDSVPVHLLTLEALDIYASKLSEDGIIAANISNRYLDLLKVLMAVSKKLGLYAVYTEHSPTEGQKHLKPSMWVAIARQEKVLKDMITQKNDINWEWGSTTDSDFIWTDDYSNILGSIKW